MSQKNVLQYFKIDLKCNKNDKKNTIALKKNKKQTKKKKITLSYKIRSWISSS